MRAFVYKIFKWKIHELKHAYTYENIQKKYMYQCVCVCVCMCVYLYKNKKVRKCFKIRNVVIFYCYWLHTCCATRVSDIIVLFRHLNVLVRTEFLYCKKKTSKNILVLVYSRFSMFVCVRVCVCVCVCVCVTVPLELIVHEDFGCFVNDTFSYFKTL